MPSAAAERAADVFTFKDWDGVTKAPLSLGQRGSWMA
jgi:hypothetical protein